MKTKFLAGLAAGLLLLVGLGGLSNAAPDNIDDAYNDSNPCDWSEFEGYNEEMAALDILRDKALQAMPAAGPIQVKDDMYIEGKDCDWDEFESH